MSSYWLENRNIGESANNKKTQQENINNKEKTELEDGNNYTKKEDEQIKFESLKQNQKTKVCIIGGGLTGLTTAYYLSKENIDIILVEKDRIGRKASGNNTAKITCQHGLIYDYLLQTQGKEKAKQYLEANSKAIEDIYKIIQDENIDCNFERQDSYVFTNEPMDLQKVQREVQTTKMLGVESEFVEKTDLPMPMLGAIKFKNQAQFNPYLYMMGLAKTLKEKENVQIYENTKVIDIVKDQNMYKIKTQNQENLTEEEKQTISSNNLKDNNTNKESKTANSAQTQNNNVNEIEAKYVVVASHYPIINIPGYYFMKMYQSMSYVIAVKTDIKLFSGMYISNTNPKISLKTIQDGEDRLLLIGGADHRTGEKIDTSKKYEELEKIAKSIDGKSVVKYKWHTEDCITLDKIPYIGEYSNFMPRVYVGTGYNKWGITSSNVAARIITDKILDKDNPYEAVFKATRVEPVKNRKEIENMIKEVTKSLVVEKFNLPQEKITDISEGEGRIIEVEGKKIGVYKDENGKIFAVKPVCTHLGCELTWNQLAKTWDCPCHGSRFDYTGKNLYGPSVKNI